MKNLKKVLALVLAMSSVFGLSVTAGAAATDFNDYDEIDNKEAVEVMTALNVIGGNNNGEFNPDGYLTRAEMCKMVSYVMNGGKAPVLGTTTTPTYSDIKGHWGEAFVEYATSMGIVGGVGGGKFAPDSTLTGTQAAKMMLTAMGYDATVFGFGGTGWDLNVNRYANEAGLYDGLSGMQPNLPITRDQAAQLMYNAMQATMMERGWTLNPATGEKTETYTPWLIKNDDGSTTPVTLLRQKYNGAIQYGYMTDFSYDDAKDVWTYTFDSNANFGGKEIGQNGVGTNKNQKSDEDYTDLFGQRVKVIYNTKDQSVTYGVYASDSSVVVEGATGNVEEYDDNAKTVTVSGKDYKLDKVASDTVMYNVGNSTPAPQKLDKLVDSKSAYSFKLVDNTGDGKIDAAIKTPMTVAKIEHVGKDTIQMSNVGSVKIDDLNIYDGYAAGDWVYYIKAENAATEKSTIVKAELKTGTVDSVRGGNDANGYTQYRIGDTWLTAANKENYEIATPEVGDTIEYVTLGSTIFYAKVTDLAATSKNVAMIITAAGKNAGDFDGAKVEAKLLFGDGSTEVVTVSKMNKKDAKDTGAGDENVLSHIGKLVTYRKDGSKYELMEVGTKNLAGYDEYKDVTGADEYKNGKVGKYELADDAIVYFGAMSDDNSDGKFDKNQTNDGDVYTGKEIKNSLPGTFDLSKAVVLTKEVNGFTYAKLVLMIDDELPEITTGSNYGYLTADTSRTTQDGKTYLNFTIHTANGELEAKAESTDDPSEYPQGSVVTYDVVSDGVIKNVFVANKLQLGAVTGWDADTGKISISSSGENFSSKVDDQDTTVLYVDSKKGIGVDGGSIRKAHKQGNKFVNNVSYIVTGDDNLALLVVDVNNKMEKNDNAPNGDAISVNNENDLVNALKYNNNNKVTVTGSIDMTGKDLYMNGNTVTVNEDVTLTVRDLNLQGGELNGEGAVVVNGTAYMGSTLNVASFTAKKAVINSDSTMNITGGKVIIKGDITGKGQLILKNNAGVDVQGKLAVNVTTNGKSWLRYETKDKDIDTKENGTGKGIYQNNKDTSKKDVNVVK